MIDIEYVELTQDEATGTAVRVLRGSESHHQIEEVLLPSVSTLTNPVFMTKKFGGVSVCRWRVANVTVDTANQPTKYVVELSRPEQVPKEFYLRTILQSKKLQVNRLLHKNHIVEIEYGHSMEAGNGLGQRVDSRRYVDTVQKGSMPKRRLAIVNQIITGVSEELVQVIPISSKAPRGVGIDRTVDVTSCLADLVDYRRQSWAICDMLETVSPNRILAPLRRVKKKETKENKRDIIVESRDTNFPTVVPAAIRKELNDALLCSVDQQFRIAAVTMWQSKETTLRSTIASLRSQEQAFKSKELALLAKVAALEAERVRIATYMGGSVEEIQEMFSDDASTADLETSTA